MDVHLQNLANLHAFEESLRPQNLALIERSESLKEHFRIVGEAMNVLLGFTRDHVHKSDDELTVQFLGIRVLNSASVSVKLALSGYYQAAFVHVRDVLETSFLLDYLLSNANKITVWKAADNKRLKNDFAPFRIREALDKRDGLKEGSRGKIYALLSEHATHVTHRGFRLTTKNGLGEIGGFVDEKQLGAWVEEMAKHLGHCAMIYSAHFDVDKAELEMLKSHHDGIMKAWMKKYVRG
jgi:hypothetical protein